MSKILRINMSDLSHKWESIPKEYEPLGGRAFTSAVEDNKVYQYVLDEYDLVVKERNQCFF